jgi:hypothetical protein
VTITEDNLLSLVEKMILRVGADSDTIAYGLSSLFKLSEKTRDRKRIIGIIKSFEDNPSLEVQKRACEYVKLLDPEWNEDRKKEICIPIPILSSAVEMFRPIPIGSTDGALDQLDLTLPEKVDFSARLQQENANRPAQPAVAVAQTTPTAPNLGKRPSAPVPVPALPPQLTATSSICSMALRNLPGRLQSFNLLPLPLSSHLSQQPVAVTSSSKYSSVMHLKLQQLHQSSLYQLQVLIFSEGSDLEAQRLCLGLEQQLQLLGSEG